MINVFAEDDGLVEAVGLFEIFGDAAGYGAGAFVDDEELVHVAVDEVLLGQLVAVAVDFALGGGVAFFVLFKADANDLVGSEEAVLNALFEGVGVDGFAEVVDVGGVGGFFGGGGEADLDGAAEIFENFAPGGIGAGAATVAFVDDDEVEEVGRELFVDVAFFFGAGDALVKRQVDFVGFFDGAAVDFDHGVAEVAEVVVFGLVDENVTVGQEEDTFGAAAAPESPHDLEGGVGFAGAGGHDEEDAVLSFGDGFDGAVDGDALVVAGHSAAALEEVVLLDDGLGGGVEVLGGDVALPEFVRRWEGVEGQFALGGRDGARAIVLKEAVTVGAVGEEGVKGFGVFQGLLDAGVEGVVVVLCFDDGDGQVGLVGVEKDVVGEHGFAAHGEFVADADGAVGEVVFFADLVELPPGFFKGFGDVAGSDFGFAEVLFAGHGCALFCWCRGDGLDHEKRRTSHDGLWACGVCGCAWVVLQLFYVPGPQPGMLKALTGQGRRFFYWWAMRSWV